MAEPVDEQAVERPSIEDLFQKLPPLNSQDYVEFLRTAPRADLPPEVLARAYRQLPLDTLGARVTLERLSRRIGKRWEYLEPLAKEARRQTRQQFRRNWEDEYKDLLQDAVRRVLEVLRTERGALAEKAWHTFCRNEFINAWRERYGRRGERIDLVQVDTHDGSEEGDKGVNPVDRLEDSFWDTLTQQAQRTRIEAIALAVADAIKDPFVRDIARATWFSSERPKTSGDTVPDRDLPLLNQFPGKSRDQVNRALRKADSQLAAALLADGEMDWSNDLRELLEKQRLRGK